MTGKLGFGSRGISFCIDDGMKSTEDCKWDVEPVAIDDGLLEFSG
jgi:hypothetical protein